MKKLITILLVLSSFIGVSQVYTPMTAAGYGYKRIKVDSTLHIPTFCGTPNLRSTVAQRSAAIAFDSCNHKFYFYDPKTSVWDTIVGGGTSNTYIDTTIFNYITNITIDSIREGETHLYFTTERVRGSLYADAPIMYDSATGTFSLDTSSITGVATKHDLEHIDTAVVSVTGYMSGDTSIILVEKNGGGTNRIYLLSPEAAAHFHDASDIISGVLPIVRGGTALGTIGTVGQSIRVATGGTTLEYYTPTAGGTTDTSHLRNDINANTAAIATKLNISDTANIRFRPIAGTNMIITGTYPSMTFNASGGGGGGGIDSVRKTIGSDTITQNTGGVKTFAFRQQRVFNVKDYGAVSDGITDATTSIQNAINAANTAGGGTVYFPNGVYIIAGAINPTYNAQLFIPFSSNVSTTRNHITLLGETKPSYLPTGGGLDTAGAAVMLTGTVILKSTLSTFTTAGQAIIGTAGNFNETFLSVENLALQIKNNPSGSGPVVGGINYKYGGSLNCKNVVVYIDTSSGKSVLPINNIVGFESPDDGAETFNSFENTMAIGLRTGYRLGEHNVLNHALAMCDYYGFDFKAAGHITTAVLAQAYWCPYDIYISGFICRLANFNLDTEWWQVGKWYDDIATIKDTANRAFGHVFYTISQAFFGVNNSKFIKIGGSNLRTSSHDEGVSPGLTIGGAITNATPGSVAYYGTGGKLQQSNSKFFWDSTNSRLGIGTNTPANDFEIKGANAYSVLNTNATTGQAQLIFRKNGISKWSLGMENASTNSDFYINDYKNSKIRLYLDSAGNMNLGGTATAAATSAIAINNSNNVTIPGALTANSYGNVTGATASGGNMTLSSTTNGTKGKIYFDGTASYYDEAAHNLVVNASTTSTDAVSITGNNAGRVSFVAQNTNSAGNTSFYFQNNRGGYASYGGVVQGGSTFGSTWFGANRSDKTFLIADGASSTGLGIGTLTNQDVILGSNNLERMRITGAGGINFSATNTAAGTTGAQTINKSAGSVNVAAAGTTLVVTNSLVTTASLVFLQVYGTDATATSARVTVATGSFTIILNAAATNETKVAFRVIN